MECGMPSIRTANTYQKEFSNGYKVGVWEIFDSDGVIVRKEIYSGGRLKQFDNTRDGKYVHYYNGKQAFYEVYKDNVKQQEIIQSDEGYKALKRTLGESVYKQYCTSCHNINDRLVGPPLRNLGQRRDSIWIVNAILDFQSLVDKKDSTALKVYAEYNMSHPQFVLTDEEIASLVKFIETASKPKD